MNRTCLSESVSVIRGSLIRMLWREARSLVVARLCISIRSGSSREKSFSKGTNIELVRTRDIMRLLSVSSVLVDLPANLL